MTSGASRDEPEAESVAISELRTRLQEVQDDLANLQEQRRQIDNAVEERRRERDALSLSIRSLGGKSETREKADGPRIEVRYRGGDRPTIRVMAREWAEESGGTLRIRDLLRETRRLGFKSGQGGLHTYLKGLEEFIQSGPGEFSLRIHAQEPDEAEKRSGKATEEAP